QHLNTILKNELTGINQYFLHARMLKHMGFMKLADYEYKESIDEMKHADLIVDRILFLEGLPNLQDLGKLSIGEDVKEILECDLKLEESGRKDLKDAIFYCEEQKDFSSADILHSILESEEDHILFIRTQLKMIESMGLSSYLQTQV
ncbi:MAG: bacterioferritin, partial [Alphaproteobacteria bacterium]